MWRVGNYRIRGPLPRVRGGRCGRSRIKDEEKRLWGRGVPPGLRRKLISHSFRKVVSTLDVCSVAELHRPPTAMAASSFLARRRETSPGTVRKSRRDVFLWSLEDLHGGSR